MPRTLGPAICAIAVFLAFPALAYAQKQSVRPGINDSFRDPNVDEFVGRFEVESREVYARRKEIFEACRIEPGQTVADIGAGTGLFTRMFSDAVGKNGKVIAVEISPKFLERIRESCRETGRQNVETVLCKDDSTELPPDSVDVAFICDAYHHFEFPYKTLATLHRALKPGGRVVLVEFQRIKGKSRDFIMSHVRAGQEVFESEFVRSGFRKLREAPDVLEENYLVVFEKGAELAFPIIANYGGVAPLEAAAEQPRTGAKVVFDATSDTKPGEVNKGLERVARLLNLYGAAGLKTADVKLAIVLHGEATKSVLTDAAYKSRFEIERNPNLPLVRELRKAGVEVFVCGQALSYKGFAQDEVADEITVAAAALTVIVNKQADGYAYAPGP
jgi:intracellular sulfur oxidation DsrE/DsrF family protein/SAM-dependent methyltransferase